MATVLAVMGATCILYGIAVLATASGTWFFAFWFVLGAVLLIGAGAVQMGWWESLSIAGKRVTGAVLCVLLVGFFATQVLIMRDFNDAGEDGLDCIIVLGAQVRDSGPSVVLRYRLDTAYEYLKRNPGTRCIVSGGRGQNEPTSEADVMADYLIERGISPGRITREDRSLNTYENIAYCKELIDPASDRVGIVTNNFHVFRGVSIARKAGYANVCGIAASSSIPYLPNNLVRESLGIAKDFATGHL